MNDRMPADDLEQNACQRRLKQQKCGIGIVQKSSAAHTARENDEKMATEWYYQIMNDEVGPLTSSQLVACVHSGKVKEDTLIRKDDSQWVPASQVNGLLDAVGNNQSKRICPYCGQTVDSPPTTCRGCNRKLVLSFNSRLTAANATHRTPRRAARNHAAEIESIRRRSDRSDVIRYLLLLALWLGLILVAPYLVYLASTGQLFFRGNLAVIPIVMVVAVVGGIYYFISRAA